jgi:hypothetical protein
MKRFWISLVAAGLLAVAAIAPVAAQDDELTIDLEEINGSGVSGTATLTGEDGTTMVDIQLEGTPEGGVHPVHIHAGTCDDLGDVVFPLEDVEEGMSQSTVEASLDEILAADHAINVHLSVDEMDVYVACGDIAMAEEEEDDAVTDEEDDAVAEDDEEVVTDDEDDAVTDDEDDAMVDDEEDAVVDEEDDAEDVVPATGSIGGFGPEAGVLMLTLAAGATLGAGLLIRRRALKF